MIALRWIFAAVLLLAAFAAGPVRAADKIADPKDGAPVVVEIKPACYTEAQYRAEQAVRYQTQLMVAGMLCQSGDPRAYTHYQAFTRRNTKTITRAENTLIGFFDTHKTPQAELSLHTLRTNMANDLSIKVMQQSMPIYCRRAAPRLAEAALLQPRQFESYLAKLNLKQPSTRPLCKDAKAGKAKAGKAKTLGQIKDAAAGSTAKPVADPAAKPAAK